MSEDNNREWVDEGDREWEFGDFDGFDDQKRCLTCGHSIHEDNYGGHECLPKEEDELEKLRESVRRLVGTIDTIHMENIEPPRLANAIEAFLAENKEITE